MNAYITYFFTLMKPNLLIVLAQLKTANDLQFILRNLLVLQLLLSRTEQELVFQNLLFSSHFSYF